MEKFLLNRIGTIALILGILIFLSWLIPLFNLPTLWFINDWFGISKLNNIISIQYMFTTIGAIFAFWYGYKKYERDKELEIIEKLEIEYKNLKLENNIKGIISFYFKEYYFMENGYITKKWWEYIDEKILHYITNIEEEYVVFFTHEIKKLTDNSEIQNKFRKYIFDKISYLNKSLSKGLIQIRQLNKDCSDKNMKEYFNKDYIKQLEKRTQILKEIDDEINKGTP